MNKLLKDLVWGDVDQAQADSRIGPGVTVQEVEATGDYPTEPIVKAAQPDSNLIAGVEDIHEAMAVAIFRTEERVKAFVRVVAEGDPARIDRAFKAAWDQDQGGWRTESINRAVEVFDVFVGLVDEDSVQ